MRDLVIFWIVVAAFNFLIIASGGYAAHWFQKRMKKTSAGPANLSSFVTFVIGCFLGLAVMMGLLRFAGGGFSGMAFMFVILDSLLYAFVIAAGFLLYKTKTKKVFMIHFKHVGILTLILTALNILASYLRFNIVAQFWIF